MKEMNKASQLGGRTLTSQLKAFTHLEGCSANKQLKNQDAHRPDVNLFVIRLKFRELG